MMNTILEYPAARPSMAAVAGIISLTAIALQVGTGGVQTADYYKQRGPMGYAFVAYDSIPPLDAAVQARTPKEDLLHIRAVLKPAVTDLAHALGVSRQAIYDWQSGKPINSDNAARLTDLARAADIFAEEGLTASAQLLRRPITSGKGLFEIAREGGSAEGAARKLTQMVSHEMRQRQMLSARLANRKRLATSFDNYGVPMLDEQS